jgi:hypothetical protein
MTERRFSYHQHTVINCFKEDNPIINKKLRDGEKSN